MACVIGLTGGIGSGKTIVAGFLREMGAVVIDADRVGRDVVEGSKEIRESIRLAFGDRFFDSDGNLRRQELGRFVFSDESRKRKLNDIVHPVLWERIRGQIQAALQQNPPLVVVDAALIFETELDKEMDEVVVVDASREIRIRRVRERDRLSDEEIEYRMSVQWPTEEKVRRADHVLINDGTMEKLKMEVRRLYGELTTHTSQ